MRAQDAEITELLHILGEARAELAAAEDESADLVSEVHGRHRSSAANLLHYLALRRRDRRPLQLCLAALGLSSLGRAEHLLTERAADLLGPAAPDRDVRIMVTMPSEAAHDYPLIHDLLRRGMDAMRNNCAHDDAEAWGRMSEHLRRAFEHLPEVQEELLWICEAAHVPVICATQVLETLAKEGMPSRAEITDAAMGHRAECVMLNRARRSGELN